MSTLQSLKSGEGIRLRLCATAVAKIVYIRGTRLSTNGRDELLIMKSGIISDGASTRYVQKKGLAILSTKLPFDTRE